MDYLFMYFLLNSFGDQTIILIVFIQVFAIINCVLHGLLI